MRNILAIGAVLLAAGCTTGPQTAPVVSWQYGTGAGDGVQYPGGKPTYTRAYGFGNGDGVNTGVKVNPNYAYGAEGQTGTMVQFAPTTPTQVAAPAPTAPASSGHL